MASLLAAGVFLYNRLDRVHGWAPAHWEVSNSCRSGQPISDQRQIDRIFADSIAICALSLIYPEVMRGLQGLYSLNNQAIYKKLFDCMSSMSQEKGRTSWRHNYTSLSIFLLLPPSLSLKQEFSLCFDKTTCFSSWSIRRNRLLREEYFTITRGPQRSPMRWRTNEFKQPRPEKSSLLLYQGSLRPLRGLWRILTGP